MREIAGKRGCYALLRGEAPHAAGDHDAALMRDAPDPAWIAEAGALVRR